MKRRDKRMAHDGNTSTDQESRAFPGGRDEAALNEKFLECLRDLLRETRSSLPLRRIQIQVEQSVEYEEIRTLWNEPAPSERLKHLKKLQEIARGAMSNVLPACVQCGECCRKGSPILYMEDLELLQHGKIPWHQVYTLRKGEPVRPLDEENDGKPFFLLDERVKIREHKDGRGCVFLAEGTDLCAIYADRPIECRAKACWDPSQHRELCRGIYLTRKEIFGTVELLMEIIIEHEKRCSFEALHSAFKRLQESRGKEVDEFVGLASYEDHFRSFLSREFKVSKDELELVLGRSFADLMPVFGLKVEEQPDGTRCLTADLEDSGEQG